MKRSLKDVAKFLSAVAALGAVVLLVFALIHLVALAIAVVVGVAVALVTGWGMGLLAGILTYAAVMKAICYLEIFDMIGSSRKSRRKAQANKAVEPTAP